MRQTSFSGTILTEYSHNGVGRLAIVDYQQPDVKLDYFQGTTGTYAGFDRFGRVKDQYWYDYTSGTIARSRVKYGYDYASNRTWRDNTVADRGEFYTYDGLHRLDNAQRGYFAGTFPNYTGIDGTPVAEQDWTLDQLGNWATLIEKTSGTTDLDQDRASNDVNEITAITESIGPAWIDPKYDAAGNMTEAPKSCAKSLAVSLTGIGRS